MNFVKNISFMILIAALHSFAFAQSQDSVIGAGGQSSNKVAESAANISASKRLHKINKVLQGLHAKLQITTAQEIPWNEFAKRLQEMVKELDNKARLGFLSKNYTEQLARIKTSYQEKIANLDKFKDLVDAIYKILSLNQQGVLNKYVIQIWSAIKR